MIKKLTVVRVLDAAQARESFANSSAVSASSPAQPGSTDGGTGTPFRAPLGELEIVSGMDPELPELLVEVSDLESVAKICAELDGVSAAQIEETAWQSRILKIRAADLELAFWESTDPRHNILPGIAGNLDARGMRFGIVVSRWNQVITERLLHGALDALHRLGAKDGDITIVRVPGAFEIPSGARSLAQTGKVDAVITLGCLIRGETTHYEHIAEEATRGIGQSAQDTNIPHAYGLLTCETLEQALDRAGLKAGNKGFEAAMSAIEMVSLQRKLPRKQAQPQMNTENTDRAKASWPGRRKIPFDCSLLVLPCSSVAQFASCSSVFFRVFRG